MKDLTGCEEITLALRISLIISGRDYLCAKAIAHTPTSIGITGTQFSPPLARGRAALGVECLCFAEKARLPRNGRTVPEVVQVLLVPRRAASEAGQIIRILRASIHAGNNKTKND